MCYALLPTPLFSKDVGLVSVLWSSYVDKNERLVPETLLPAVKTDLKALNIEKDTVVWLGHSSWFIQLGGKRILIDPVFSDHAAPFSFMNKAFGGTNIYGVEDMPVIDCLLISHDHWDHLDYSTVTAIDLGARALTPAHVGRFTIADHHWDEPFKRMTEASQGKSYRLLTPIIGAPVAPDDNHTLFFRWWDANDKFRDVIKGGIL